MSNNEWKSTPALAWTEREGPGRAPRGAAPWTWFATAGTLGVVFSVMFMTDALCPEHRAWVDALAGLALFGTIAAITGLVRGWSTAPFLAVAVGLIGAVIGAIDAVHEPVRGGFIAGGFVLAVLLGGWMTLRQAPLIAWDRRLRRDARFGPAESPTTSSVPDGAFEQQREAERASTGD